MNKNETSLVSHALKLYDLQYNDNIELRGYSNHKFIEVGDRNIQHRFILNLYNGTADISLYKSRNTSSKLNNNIRSFINHWMQYYNFDEDISYVAVLGYRHNTFDIAISCDDNCWYRVLLSPYNGADDWSIYKW